MDMEKELVEHVYDLIILGAGPAGMTASIYASRGGLDVAIFDFVPGGKLNETGDVENYPGINNITGPELAHKMAEHAVYFGSKLIPAYAERIIDKGRIKEVETFDKIYQAKAVLIATGTKERKLGIPGEEEFYGRGVSYCAVCDGAFYKDKVVIVIGGGDSAYEAADYLARFASEVHVVLRRHFIRAEKINQKRVNENPKIFTHFAFSPVEIKGDDAVTSVVFKNNKDEDAPLIELEASAIFPQIGIIPNSDFVKDLDILDDKGYIIANDNMETKIPGIYAAGDIISKNLRQIVTATRDGAIAGEEISKYVLHDLSETA